MKEESEKSKTVQGYRRLLVWQKSCLLVKKGLRILREVRKDFVSWVIVKQAVRSLLSARSNIVEGWCGHPGRGLVSYLEISRGSVGETEDWFYALYEEGYITEEACQDFSRDCEELIAMLTSFVSKIKQKAH